MAFRDDRDAQLARAAALERENRRLEEELERHKAEAAAAEARGRAASAGKREAALAEENAELREELERARGPGMLRRAGAWLAGLRLAEPSGEGTYWRAALATWRIHVPLFVGLLVTAPVLGTRAIVLALLAPIAAVALAAILLPIPWLLRRRPRVVAGAIAGAASGPPFSLALFDRLSDGGVSSALYLAMLSVLVAGAGLLLTRAVKWHAALGPAAIFSPLLALPTPAHVLLWMGLGFAGALLVDPNAARD